MRPFIAQRLREYWMTALQATVCDEEEVMYFRKRLALTKERYIQATARLHELLVEITMLNANDKVIQEQCLRLIHVPFPTVERPPADLGKEAVRVWFEASVIDIDERIEEEYLHLFHHLICYTKR
jgi:hypothetical protein